METVQLTPRSKHELDRWVNLLLDNKADYRIRTVRKQQFLLLHKDDCINILGIEPPETPKWVKTALIVI